MLQRALGPKAGAQLRDAAKGVDTRAWEARPPRKSVGAQVTWGVRFEEASEAVAFVEKLCGEVGERMRRLKVKGRTLTLKILRAVANAPANYMKGSIGHGVCDSLTRSSTVSESVDDGAALAIEAVRLLADLNVPADQIRGVGVQVSKLDSDPASRTHLGGAFRGFKSAPAGRRSDWTDRASRYAGWYDVAAQVGKPGDDSTGTGEVGANAYASAIGARGGTLERALFKAGKEASGPNRGNQTEEKNDTDEPDEPPEDTEEDDGEGDDADEDDDGMMERGDESLAAAYESAARTFAWEKSRSKRKRTDEPADADVRGEPPEEGGETLEESGETRAASLLRGAESFLLELAGARFRSGGAGVAAATVDSARRLARSQECVPGWVHALTGGGEWHEALARCWRGACDRVEDEIIAIVHSQ